MAKVVNIAAYRFAPLTDLPRRRAELKQLCQRLGLKGTILLSREGVNLFVAGPRAAVEELVAFLRGDPLLADLEIKESLSDHQPFRRMLVRLKKEIIAFGVPNIDPRGAPAPSISAQELKQWLDEGRDVVLLDTRNDYEVKLGAFRNAVHLDLKSFRDFPAAAATLGEALKTKPVVMYCTGGIRCEKAAPFLQQQGFQSVYQLEGGILKYFEECGGQHYDGECFVFDQRVAVSPSLSETDAAICFACQSSLTYSEQQSPRYVPGESCPYCYQPPEEKLHARREAFAEALRRVVTPLPGSQPYDHRRPMNVPARYDGLSLLEMLDRWHPHVGCDHWRDECRQGRLEGDQGVLTAESVVRAGERIEHLLPATIEPEVSSAIELLYEDEHLVVVNKPAPLPMHSGGRYHRNTLTHLLQPIFVNCKLRTVHRLDANTSGVVVCARTRAIATRLQTQFQQRGVEKNYLALVAGNPAWERYRCDLAIGSETEQAGIRLPAANGRPAVTEFEVLSRTARGALLSARPLTGRTNQIRIHLWSLGSPVVGDPAFLPGGALAAAQTLSVHDPPMCLHAQSIALRHPISEKPVRFEAPDPTWLRELT